MIYEDNESPAAHYEARAVKLDRPRKSELENAIRECHEMIEMTRGLTGRLRDKADAIFGGQPMDGSEAGLIPAAGAIGELHMAQSQLRDALSQAIMEAERFDRL